MQSCYVISFNLLQFGSNVHHKQLPFAKFYGCKTNEWRVSMNEIHSTFIRWPQIGQSA